MTIILPNEKEYSSPMDYLNKEKINFHEISSKLNEEEKIHLYLPKFKYESEINFTSILEKLGMKLSFTDSADFSNLVDGQCFISKLFQKTYINLNENGTEAAAATAIEIVGSPENQEVEIQHYMYVNHSFIYMIESNEIKDIDNNNIMPFIGIVNYIEGEKVSTSSDDPTEEPKDEPTDDPTDDTTEKPKDDPTDEPEKILPVNLGNNSKVSFGIICFILLSYL